MKRYVRAVSLLLALLLIMLTGCTLADPYPDPAYFRDIYSNGVLLVPGGGAGDMTTAVYDPDVDGIIAAAQLDANIIYEGDSRLTDARTPLAHNQDANTITTGTLDGDRLPAMSQTKKGAVPLTGVPSGKYLRDDGTFQAIAGGGDMTKAVYDPNDDGVIASAQLDPLVVVEGDVDDAAVDGATTDPISSNWAFDHDAAVTGVHGVGAGTVAKTADITKTAVGLDNVTNDAQAKAADKDASGGHVGLTLLKINFKNVLNTITSWFTNSNTVARTYTFQDRDGTIADDTDLTGKVSHSLATAANDFLVASGAGTWAKQTLAQVKATLGLGTAAYTASTDYVTHALATAANDFLVASGAGTYVKKTLAETLTILGKNVASGLAPLDAASKVPTANLGGAGADNTKYLRGDQTWQVPAGGAVASDVIWDTKGDLAVATGADAAIKLASSAVNNNVLTVDTTTATGLKWAAPAGGNDPRISVDAVTTGEQHDITASTALTKVTVIDIPLTAGTYVFRYDVIFRSNQLTEGIRLAVSYSGTNGAFVWNWRGADLSALASTAAADQDSILATGDVQWNFASRVKSSTTRGTTISVDTINADMYAVIEGVFVATGAGNLELWHGNETATVAYTTSVMIGTSIVVTKTK